MMLSEHSIFDTVRTVSSPTKTLSCKLNLAEDLQALGLIPRSPSPIPLEDRPEESLSREEALELLRRHKVSSQPRKDKDPR